MTALYNFALDGLREAREELLSIKKQDLTHAKLIEWRDKYQRVFQVAGRTFGGPAIWNPMVFELAAHQGTVEPDILAEVRDRLIERVDAAMKQVDSTKTVRPVLDELILKVKDTKLATLLKEFNASKDNQPNLAAIGFRTILCLVIQEIAKIKDPEGRLATRQDLALEPMIEEALAANLFDQADARLVKRFRDGGQKDVFDIVVHKPGEKALVNKDDLSSAVNVLLDTLLKELV
jgi:hypothetical protein